ncbi:hypothetical protein SUGI_0721470 [Cryptomeria japonica]|uniref:serine acetyltransferase 5 n=1 Tax=Cryptomeria japonica TaxID=3369 RepID=UPI002414B7A7|nr:serine acetyltransferase 5 [Cryptomeria japonica]GLJ35960.1 hypothetical protein SUGI_0721470 [Cryptomeria japonica]
MGILHKEEEEVWEQLRREAAEEAETEPLLANYLNATILVHKTMESALAFHLADKLATSMLPTTLFYNLLLEVFTQNPRIGHAVRADICAVKTRDPACISYSHCMLSFKGFLGCQAHRVAHRLWSQGRFSVALAIQSRVSEVFAMDIHPAARIGEGVHFDHATGLVIGETAVIGDNVTILHHVTLGGSGKHGGDRHPKIGKGVLIGAGASILGNVNIGEGAKIGAGAVVLIDVPPKTTAVGNPARLIGGKCNPSRLTANSCKAMDHMPLIPEWSDYVI